MFTEKVVVIDPTQSFPTGVDGLLDVLKDIFIQYKFPVVKTELKVGLAPSPRAGTSSSYAYCAQHYL